MTKLCQYCATEMKRPQKVSYAQWERQRFCCKRCANLAGATRGAEKKIAPEPSWRFHPALSKFMGV